MSGLAKGRDHRREAHMRAVDSDKTFLRAPPEARVRRNFSLLTSTYIDVGYPHIGSQRRSGRAHCPGCASSGRDKDELNEIPQTGFG
jgi:hypothetical protein